MQAVREEKKKKLCCQLSIHQEGQLQFLTFIIKTFMYRISTTWQPATVPEISLHCSPKRKSQTQESSGNEAYHRGEKPGTKRISAEGREMEESIRRKANTYIHTYIHTLLTFPRGFSKTIHDPIYN